MYDAQGNYIGTYDDNLSTATTAPPKLTRPINKPPVPSSTVQTTVKDLTVIEDSGAGQNLGTINLRSFDGASALENTVTPLPNILDQYASYTYVLSLYMLTTAQYNQLSATSKLDISSWSLILQSGGASQQQQQTQPTTNTGSVLEDATVSRFAGGTPRNNISAVPGRNKYFSLDYYIDDLTIDAAFTDARVTNAGTIKFKVMEPNGITFMENLAKAALEIYDDPNGNMRTAKYVLAIKFYGWDINGNLVTRIKQAPGSAPQLPNDYNASIIKYFPFNLGKISFKVAGKGIEYEIEGAASQFTYGQALGSVPNNFELTGTTVDDILNGRVLEKTITTTISDGRESTNAPAKPPKPTVSSLPIQQQAAIAAGTDYNLVNDQGMAFGGGGL